MFTKSNKEIETTLKSTDHMLGLLEATKQLDNEVVDIKVAGLYIPAQGSVICPHGWIFNKAELAFIKQ